MGAYQGFSDAKSAVQFQSKKKQLTFYINRFRALPRANKLFADVPKGTILSRPLFGYRYFCDVSREGPQKLLYLCGKRNITEAALVQSLLRSGMRVMDIGANIGYYVLLIEQVVGPAGKIFAIEPSPENLPELTMNVFGNGLSNVHIIKKAVGNESKIVGLSAGINSGVMDDGSGTYTIEIDLIDNIAHESIDVIKMDIEGYEGFALEGAYNTIKRYHPSLFIEVHPFLLDKLGYPLQLIIDNIENNYRLVRFYKQRNAKYFYEKFLINYFNKGLEEIYDKRTFLNSCKSKNYIDPFWVVAVP